MFVTEKIIRPDFLLTAEERKLVLLKIIQFLKIKFSFLIKMKSI